MPKQDKSGQRTVKNQWQKQLKLWVKNFVIKGHESVVSWNKQTEKSAWSITRIFAYFSKDFFSKNILNVKIQAKGKHNKERVLQVSLLWRASAILASEESQSGNEKVGKKMETVTDFIFLGSKITADGDCSHEIKIRLLPGRKAMTNLDSILKSRDITLPTKVHIVKAMFVLVVMYGCERWP